MILFDKISITRYLIGMQEIDVNLTILIVVGIDLKPEEVDRPLAYNLKKEIESSPLCGDHPFRKCLVISDGLYTNDKIIQACPSIIIGGPGVNSAASQLVEKLPVYLSRDNRVFIQLDNEFKNRKISIWGMDRQATEEAVNLFISDGILDDFLKSIWI